MICVKLDNLRDYGDPFIKSAYQELVFIQAEIFAELDKGCSRRQVDLKIEFSTAKIGLFSRTAFFAC